MCAAVRIQAPIDYRRMNHQQTTISLLLSARRIEALGSYALTFEGEFRVRVTVHSYDDDSASHRGRVTA